eukprot:s1454_g6.t1
MALVFVKGDDVVKPIVLSSGAVVRPDHLQTAPDADETALTAVLSKVNKDDLIGTLTSLGLRFNRKGMNKSSMVRLIAEHMALMKEQASKKYDKSKAKSSTEVEDLATDGCGSLMRKIEQADATITGFRVFFLQDRLRVLTGVGVYQVADNDAEALDFLKSNNCLLLGKLDMEEEASDSASEDDAVEVLDVDDDDINIFDYIPGSYLNDVSDFSDDEGSPLPSEGGADVKPLVIKFVAPMTSKPILTLKLADTKIDIGTLKSKVVEKIASLPHSDKKKHLRVDDFVVMYDGSVLPDDVLIHYICDDDDEITFTLLLRLKGGGVEVRKTHLKVKKSNTRTLTTADDENIFQNAFHCAKVVGSSDNFTLETLFGQLSMDKMNEALDMVKGKANTIVKLESLAELSPSWVQLDEAATLIENAKMVVKEKLSQSIMTECSVGSKFKLPELKKKIEIAIAVRKSSASNDGKAFAGAGYAAKGGNNSG